MLESLACRIGAWCVLTSLCTAAFAQPEAVGAPRTIGMAEAIANTLSRNPSLTAFGHELQAQEGRIIQSELRPNLEVGVLVENVLGTDEFESYDSAETTLSLGWLWERGKREYRVEAARAGLSVLESEAEYRRLNAAAETAHIVLDCLAQQERLLRLDEAVELAEQAVRTVQRRVQAGKSPDAELSRAEADRERVRLQLEDASHLLLTAYRRLAAQWGESEPGFDRVAGDLYELPEPDGFAALVERLEHNPEIQRHLARQQQRETELRLAEAEARPDWRFTAGARRFEYNDDYALVAGLTIPLTTRNRNQGRIAEAQARLALSGADEAARRIELETELFVLHQELTHNLHRTAALSEQILPRVEAALGDTERAYELGRYGYLELQSAQREVLDARTALVGAAVDAHRSVIEIERLTGAALPSAETRP
jgi:cobalt-zinc-cadmium efflux system outer membrane protein